MAVKGKTPEGLVAHANRALKEKWWYVWGTFGQVLTSGLLESKASQYPYYNGGSKKAIHAKYIGRRVSDCVGLIKGYCMWDSGVDNPIYAASLDHNTGMMYNAAKVKGVISTIPDRPGVCVYMSGHVGVYVGNGYVIECAGSRGAIKTPLVNGTPWTHWFECPFIDYGKSSTPNTVEKPESNSPQLGDYVRVKPGAKTYTGGNLASWVYEEVYDVMEVAGNRAVIGKGSTVTAAMNIKDLIVL